MVVLDNTFAQVASFTDPSLPAGYAPYNVALLGGNLYVAYALRNGDDARAGAGLGYIDVFHTDGTLVTTLVANGTLNAPWGMAIAPSSFGDLAGSLLVANNRDGRINAFDPNTGTLMGTMSDPTGASLQIEGLRALHNSGSGSIFFSADPKRRNKRVARRNICSIDEVFLGIRPPQRGRMFFKPFPARTALRPRTCRICGRPDAASQLAGNPSPRAGRPTPRWGA